MKPIEPKDIKAGDHIRFEYKKEFSVSVIAHEYRATTDEHMYMPGDTGQHYRLERPKTLLYPAGTDLWLTEDHYPWEPGDKITLDRDWYEGDDGHVRGGWWVAFDSVIDKRPEPAVELPTEPTWGVLEFTSGPNTKRAGQTRRVFAEWYPAACISGFSQSETPTQMHATDLGMQVPMRAVTAFTPATPVPNEALDELRRSRDRLHFADTPATRRIDTFLAAIDGVPS